MPRAFWNNQMIADAPPAAIQRVEGNIYFPPVCGETRILASQRIAYPLPMEGGSELLQCRG